MSNNIVTGHFEPDGAIIYVPVGFVPDFLFVAEYGATNPLMYYWWGQEMEDAESTEGIIDTAGTKTIAAAAGGFAAYDTGVQAPQTLSAITADWTASTAYTAKSATKRGDLVRGTVTGTDKNGLLVDRSVLFECVTAGTTDTTEPTWPADIGDDTATDNGVIWRKVTDEPTYLGGYKGFAIAAALMTNGQEFYYTAMMADTVIDHGDVVNWPGGIQGV